ncbi:LON peptidase N-terminal domain and RING finger protein 1 [Tolypocladium ophioglossoides CBS 100239]|uniref:LON peptidase N-terminal domain and RING finger protein 1 n=1 Tax=Tolypocladium ophioglossoides (strain CBS 100239) TaxID=1163406 RepID=A0A0L0NDT3_TOLOC|nr:LON peptidase N-terminal domain and RING finger protein 1 [Tolypocladium ophioglossoides CBS 100239]
MSPTSFMSDRPNLAASSPLPGPEVLRGAASQYTPGTAPLGLRELRAEEEQQPRQQRRQQCQPQTEAQKEHQQDSRQTAKWQGQDQHGQDQFPVEKRTLSPEQTREIVRLFQCRRCSIPYRDAVTLPCGRSICKTCLPEARDRTSITYLALPNRLQAFLCPFEECSKEHVLNDCGVDVLLNKTARIMEDEIERAKADALDLRLSTHIAIKDPWEVAGVASLKEDDNSPRLMNGGRLVATWTLAAEGGLLFEAEVTYRELPSSSTQGELMGFETKALGRVQEAMRSEMDCQVCYALFYEPLTTGCGHTFCRPCLHRILDHSRYCPICRRKLAINPLLNRSSCPANESITKIMETFWKDELVAREETAAAELAARHQNSDLPLFVCTLAFPMMPTFLHIFEPRYRLMIRRALEGDRTFGMVLPKRPRHSGDTYFHELGTLLRIVNAQFYPDGRSLIETVGLSRFRVLQHGQFDGYTVGKMERIDDVSLEEEESMEAAEVGHDAGMQATEDNLNGDHDIRTQDTDNNRHGPHVHGNSSRPGSSRRSMRQSRETTTPGTVADLDTMTTQSLMRFATGFVARMREQSVPWLTERMLGIYGECPDDPAVFPWWFASTLPVKDLEKYRLLGTSSVRDRLKICGSWIIEMETVRW